MIEETTRRQIVRNKNDVKEKGMPQDIVGFGMYGRRF